MEDKSVFYRTINFYRKRLLKYGVDSYILDIFIDNLYIEFINYYYERLVLLQAYLGYNNKVRLISRRDSWKLIVERLKEFENKYEK